MGEYLNIDAHSHLWLHQDTTVDGQAIRTLSPNGSRSLFFGEEVQMLPPFMIDGQNTAEIFLSNMDYAQVAAAVVVQEVIDGCQNDYLADVQRRFPDRFFCMGMVDLSSQKRDGEEATSSEEKTTLEQQVAEVAAMGLRGIAIPGHRLRGSLLPLMPLFKEMERRNMVLSMCLADDAHQIAEMEEVIEECPRLRVAIGHFGMVTTPSFMQQVRLAHHPQVMIESGGITWLYNSEFYPFPTACRSIRQAADEVGMEHLMWGSDYPRTITAITYRMSYDFLLKSSLFSDEEKRLFMGENAARFYGLHPNIHLPYIKNMSE